METLNGDARVRGADRFANAKKGGLRCHDALNLRQSNRLIFGVSADFNGSGCGWF